MGFIQEERDLSFYVNGEYFLLQAEMAACKHCAAKSAAIMLFLEGIFFIRFSPRSEILYVT